jgi:hypothetical protein
MGSATTGLAYLTSSDQDTKLNKQKPTFVRYTEATQHKHSGDSTPADPFPHHAVSTQMLKSSDPPRASIAQHS